jgi:histidine triad (HIT) family protein
MRDGCVFCDYAGPNTILWETSAVYVVEPLRQVTPGHLLVIPRTHAADFADDPAVTAEVFRGAAEFAQAHGIEDANLITSRGESASQTVMHVHIHVLPRTWDDAVRLPWNNPHVSPSPTHHLYQRYRRESAALLETIGALRKVEDEWFEWEAREAGLLVGHADRYMRKIGEVLYCGWHGCLHADEPGDRWVADNPTDYVGRAIPIGEGVQHFKGRIHADCAEAMRKERD